MGSLTVTNVFDWVVFGPRGLESGPDNSVKHKLQQQCVHKKGSAAVVSFILCQALHKPL